MNEEGGRDGRGGQRELRRERELKRERKKQREEGSMLDIVSSNQKKNFSSMARLAERERRQIRIQESNKLPFCGFAPRNHQKSPFGHKCPVSGNECPASGTECPVSGNYDEKCPVSGNHS